MAATAQSHSTGQYGSNGSMRSHTQGSQGSLPQLPVYKLSDLRAKHVHDLRKIAKQLDIHYNPAQVADTEDLVLVICQSGKIALVSEDGRPLHRASGGAMAFHRETSVAHFG